MPGRGPAMSSPFRALAASAISPCSSRAAWASTPSPSPAGKDKEKLALELGAHRYIDSETQDAAKALMALGGAKVILATVTSGKAMTPLIDGLGVDGTLLVVGASPEPIEVNPFHIHRRAARRARLAVGHLGRFRGHAALQRADRRRRR